MGKVPPVSAHAPVGGWVDARYTAVCEVFGQLFNTGRETGAAVAVVRDGRLVLDLHGGWRDAARTRPWSADTLTPLFCTGKPVAAIAVLMLAARGVVDLDLPVARYWPSFAAAGKEHVLIRHLLTHSAGLPAFPIPRPARLIPRWDVLADDLATAAPEWPAGTAVGEHALTYGHLLGELVRRVDGRPLGVFLREEIAHPHDLGIALGLTHAQTARAAELEYADPNWYRRTVGPPFTVRQRALDNPDGCLDPQVLNASWCRAAAVPAVTIHATARSLAQLIAGLLPGQQRNTPAVLDTEHATAMTTAHVYGYDLVLDRPVRRGFGVLVEPDGRWGVAAFGGNLLAVDPRSGQVLVYLTRRLGDHTAAYSILQTTRSCAG